MFLYILLFNPQISFAKSTYVLPYPSIMPGNKFYILTKLKEKIDSILYFGNLSQFTFNLQTSDKYLVEAKTLFEYGQYLLGEKSLQESDMYFAKTSGNLLNAKKSGENISEKIQIQESASQKHIEVLQKLIPEVPEDFYWQPEKAKGTRLNLGKLINNSIQIRRKVL